MTHKAMMSQYYSVIHGMDYAETDRALAALPLYHTAQTHAFTMPQLLVGARTILIEAPAADVVLRSDRAGADHLVLRPAHGLDQPAASSGFRQPRPDIAGKDLLRRLDHARSGAA